MAGEVNWKMKYNELKAKFMDSVDLAFRLGMEQGLQQAQLDQAAQAQMQQEQAAQQQAQLGGGQQVPGQEDQQFDDGSQGPTQPAGPGQGIQPPESQNPDGSELDQHIAKLESMISKSEGVDVASMMQTIGELKKMQKAQALQAGLAKSAKAIPAIAKALHKPAFRMSQQANHNLNSSQKEAVTMQKRIVDDIMAKWESEENRAGTDILKQLGIEGLTKKE